MVHVALAIAGSEATGGAGAQTDIKTFHQLGVFGTVTLTCIVSFDPQDGWAHRFVPIDPGTIADQIESSTAVHEVDAVKLGMLGTPGTIDVVAGALAEHDFRHVVLDPVMICKEGEGDTPARATDDALMAKILPRATFVTPNLGETRILAGTGPLDSLEDLTAAARAIHERWGVTVLAKGGVELAGEDAVDVFVDDEREVVLRSPKIGEHRVSGAGCTLAAAVTAELAKGADALDAARTAKRVVTSAIEHRQHGRALFDAVYQGFYRG